MANAHGKNAPTPITYGSIKQLDQRTSVEKRVARKERERLCKEELEKLGPFTDSEEESTVFKKLMRVKRRKEDINLAMESARDVVRKECELSGEVLDNKEAERRAKIKAGMMATAMKASRLTGMKAKKELEAEMNSKGVKYSPKEFKKKLAKSKNEKMQEWMAKEDGAMRKKRDAKRKRNMEPPETAPTERGVSSSADPASSNAKKPKANKSKMEQRQGGQSAASAMAPRTASTGSKNTVGNKAGSSAPSLLQQHPPPKTNTNTTPTTPTEKHASPQEKVPTRQGGLGGGGKKVAAPPAAGMAVLPQPARKAVPPPPAKKAVPPPPAKKETPPARKAAPPPPAGANTEGRGRGRGGTIRGKVGKK